MLSLIYSFSILQLDHSDQAHEVYTQNCISKFRNNISIHYVTTSFWKAVYALSSVMDKVLPHWITMAGKNRKNFSWERQSVQKSNPRKKPVSSFPDIKRDQIIVELQKISIWTLADWKVSKSLVPPPIWKTSFFATLQNILFICENFPLWRQYIFSWHKRWYIRYFIFQLESRYLHIYFLTVYLVYPMSRYRHLETDQHKNY